MNEYYLETTITNNQSEYFDGLHKKKSKRYKAKQLRKEFVDYEASINFDGNVSEWERYNLCEI